MGMRIALVGVAGSGKDYLASILIKNLGFNRVSFADPLRAVCASIFDIGEYASDDKKDTIIEQYGMTAREIWIKVSATIRSIDDNIWIGKTLDLINQYGDDENIIITDCRTITEMQALHELGFKFIWINRRENTKPLNQYDIDNTLQLSAYLSRSQHWVYDNDNYKDENEFIEYVNNVCSGKQFTKGGIIW
jgi:adenylate kinase family enzyme